MNFWHSWQLEERQSSLQQWFLQFNWRSQTYWHWNVLVLLFFTVHGTLLCVFSQWHIWLVTWVQSPQKSYWHCFAQWWMRQFKSWLQIFFADNFFFSTKLHHFRRFSAMTITCHTLLDNDHMDLKENNWIDFICNYKNKILTYLEDIEVFIYDLLFHRTFHNLLHNFEEYHFCFNAVLSNSHKNKNTPLERHL